MLLDIRDGLHFIISERQEKYVKLYYNGSRLAVNNRDVFLSESKSSWFYVDRGFLMHSDNYVAKGPYGNLFLTSTPNNVISVVSDNFDIPYSFRGSYAFIYYPSLSCNEDSITRISSTEDHRPIPVSMIDPLSKYCLFPISSERKRNLILEEFKKCQTSRDIILGVKTKTFGHFVRQFRNMFEFAIVSKQQKFFHGDISLGNIIRDDDTLKLIDFDFHLFTDQIETTHRFNSKMLEPIYPLFCNLVMIRHVVGRHISTLPEVNLSQYLEYSKFYVENFKMWNLNRLIIQNLVIDEHSSQLCRDFDFSNFDEVAKVFNYTTLYQLTIVLLYYTNLSNDPQHLLEPVRVFCETVLNFKDNGFISPESALEKYDMMLSFI